ncbi:ANK2 [Symbiodinium sp. CCMP2592]|nr:ANK2 [Symbiodinium sp. CCMP2592]
MARMADLEREAFLEENNMSVAQQSAHQSFFQGIRFLAIMLACFVAFATTGIVLKSRASGILPAAADASTEKWSSAASGKLMGAVWSYDVDMAKQQLQHGANPDTKDGNGQSALRVATSYYQWALAKLLLANGASVDNPNIVAAAVSNIEHGHGEETAALLLDKAPKYANIALRNAAGICNVKIAKLALAKGAQINEADDLYGEMPLHRAVDAGGCSHSSQLSMVKFLLANGAQVNATDHDGRTPLHVAVRHYDPSISMVKFLLANGAQVNATAHDGRTPLHDAASQSFSVPIAELLLAKGAKADAEDEAGFTPLHYATQNLCAKMVKFLLKVGAPIDARSKNGHTPLHALYYRYWDGSPNEQREAVEIAKLLLASGADISAKTSSGSTLLSMAQRSVQKGPYKTFAKFVSAQAK